MKANDLKQVLSLLIGVASIILHFTYSLDLWRLDPNELFSFYGLQYAVLFIIYILEMGLFMTGSTLFFISLDDSNFK